MNKERSNGMKNKMIKLLGNGSGEKLAYWGLILTIFFYFLRATFGSGEYKKIIEINCRDIAELKNKMTVIEEIKKDISELKANQEGIKATQNRMLEILQGKYEKK